jgi:putative DNA primase/helicase
MSALPDFSQFCEAACIKIWGEPQLRTPKQLRWSGDKGDNGYGARTYNVSKRTWYDHGAGRGGSTLELIAYSKGKPDEKLRGRAFIDMWKALAELDVGAPPPKPKGGGGKWPPILRTFPYHDEASVLLFEVVRFDTTDPDERFRQRRPDGKGDWIWNLKGVRRVLYALPALIAAVKAGERVLVTEGERDANTAVKLGYVATTMPGGVKKWRAEYDEFLRGADVVVVADNDAPGQEHAAKLAKRLAKVAAQVRGVMFQNQKDLSAWVEAGGTREQLDAIIAQAPEQIKPQPEEEEEPKDEEESKDEESPIDPDAEIERLAKLTAIEYEQQRKAAAEKLDIRASILDKLVAAERVRLGLDGGDNGKQGRAIAFPEPEPWPEPVSGAELLDGIAAAVRNHVVMPDHCRDTCALWVMHSYLVDRFLVSPRLGIRSPTKGCGKTLLLDVLGRLVARPLPTANVTPAATFRVVEAHRPTLLIDEADTFLYDNDELRGVLNGNRKGSTVLRTVGDDHEPRAFSVYTAVAIALIGALPDTLHDRSVPIDLQRRRPNEKIMPFRPDRADHLDVLARKTVRWAKDHADRVAEADPSMPDGIINRAADNWRPLLAIADEAGWSERARKAAEASRSAEGDDASRLELLLGDIRDIRDDKDITQISSGDLVQALVDKESRPWVEMGKTGKPLTQAKLARMLKAVRIPPQKIMVPHQGGITGQEINKEVRGYVFADFEEAFERYLPAKGDSKCRSVGDPTNTGTSENSKVSEPETFRHFEKAKKSSNDGLSDTSTLSKGGSGGKTHVRTKVRHDVLRATDGNPLYTGPVVDVPDQGPDPLDAHGQPTAAPDQGTVASVPFMLTQEMKRRLRVCGYSDGEIATMTPQRAHDILGQLAPQPTNGSAEGGFDDDRRDYDDDRRQELVDRYRKWMADGMDRVDLEDDLRFILREEVPPELVEIEFRRVMQAVFAGA